MPIANAARAGDRAWLRAAFMTILAAAICGIWPVLAQEYPDRTVRIIIPFPAGGTADAMPRAVGDWLSRKWGQSVVIENRAGAGGNVGAQAAYDSDPDGYTLLSAPPSPLAINHNLYRNLGYDPTRFVPIILLALVPNALLVSPGRIAAKSIKELIDHMRANAGKVTAATQGIGTTSHLTAEMFQAQANVKLKLEPYRGSAPALQALVAGSADVMFDNLGASLALVGEGKLRLVAVATPKRLASMAQVPTVAETLPGFESSTWFAVVAPPATPSEIVAKLNADINEALRDADVRKRIMQLSGVVIGGTPQAAGAHIREETERWRKVLRSANVKLQ
ncbi:MAG: tripartite tricarboxylate transporter substrate binding protein [Proteobacteria bacterium]|nr:tripartite tricarboxylate transporter substrate binding protein [Pseudomonadota bacterium]